MTITDHPEERLDRTIAAHLSSLADAAEKLGDLHPEQWRIIHDHHWLRMFVPERLGGLGLSLPEAVRIEETLSWTDGCVGWVVTLCSGAGWFVGFLQPNTVEEFFSRGQLCIAGSGTAAGRADVVPEGYRVKGTWPFASGILHATALTANCLVYENDVLRINDHGAPEIRSFIFNKEEAVVHHTWEGAGMVATASHSFTVNDLVVPATRAFHVDAAGVVLRDPVFRYPFLQFAEFTLAANISGMTIRYIELASERASASILDHDMAIRVITELAAALSDMRRSFFSMLDESWHRSQHLDGIPAVLLEQCSFNCHSLVNLCRSAVDTLHPFYAAPGQRSDSGLDRVYRNIITALQHALFRTT